MSDTKAPTLKELRRKGVVKWPVETINRIEVIGAEGRMFVKYLAAECIAEVKYQDNGKTMKVFLKEAQK